MQTPNFDDTLEGILKKDPRYHRDAYAFVREALDYTQKLAARTPDETAVESPEGLGRTKPHHVTGQQLLEGIRRFALEQFGPMSLMVLHEWGVRTSQDFGEIVYNMVESSLLDKTKDDNREHFRDGYDFFEAFRRPFLPSPPKTEAEPEHKPTRV